MDWATSATVTGLGSEGRMGPDDLLRRLIKIVGVSKDKTTAAPDAKLVAAAAEAFAKRTESRLGGLAA